MNPRAPQHDDSEYVVTEAQRGVMCTRKRAYSKVEAQPETTLFRRTGRGRHGQPENLRMYQCPFCTRWHVTKA